MKSVRSQSAARTIPDERSSAPDAAAFVADPAVVTRLAEVSAAVGMRLCPVDPAAGPAGSGAALLRTAQVVLVDIAQVPAVPRTVGSGVVIALAPAEPTAAEWQECLSRGVRMVHQLDRPDEELISILASCLARAPAATRGQIIAVTGACGGAGTSVFATALAVRAKAAGRSVLLCDTDHCGVGLDMLLGIEGTAGTCWMDIGARHISAESLQEALPRVGGRGAPLRVMGFGRGPRDAIDPELAVAVMAAGSRAGDLVILDLLRCAEVSGALLPGADLALLLAPADLRGSTGAARAASALTLARSAGMVVRGPAPGGLAAAEIARAVGVPLVAAMRPQPGLDRDLDRGRAWRHLPRSPLARAADRVLARVDGAV